MDCLLVATDMSPRGDRALRRAARLAAAHDAALHVVHVIDHGLPEAIAATVDSEARGMLLRLCRDAGAGPDGAPEIHVVQGDTAPDVHATARRIGAELVVLGAHRPRPVVDLFRETTLERLVRLSQRPVLVVRDPADRDYAQILAALDFSPASTGAARLALALFPEAETRGFHAFHVAFGVFTEVEGNAADGHDIREAQAEFAAWIAGGGPAAFAERTEIAEGGLHQVLQRQFAAHRPDLLALGAHGRTGKAPFLLGSFANDMMRDPPCDLLIARH